MLELLRRNLRWQIIAIIFAGTVINYIARNSLGILAPDLEKHLHISTQHYSYVVGAFQAGYIIMLPVCGLVIDRFGLKFGYALFATIWSLANMLHAFAGGWLSLAIFRGVLGMSEAAVIPAGVKAATLWFPARERAAAIGWVNVGTALGAVLAVPIVAGLALKFDWRVAFIATGALGLVWALVWWRSYAAPDTHPRLTADERAYINEGRGAEAGATPLSVTQALSMLGQPKFWVIAVPRFLAEPAWQTFSFWVPLYFVTVRHFELKQIALFAWLPFLCADLGGLCGGYISPLIARYAQVGLIRARVIGVAFAALLMIAPGFIGVVASPYVAIIFLCIGGFAHQTLSVLINTLTADCYPKEEVGTANGFVSQAGWIGGLLFSLAIGRLADSIGYAPLFGALGVFDLIGALILLLFIHHLIAAQEAQTA
ncbi:MAG: MFS transporter [Alphaproteobacteria bacterium]|nr:MFS transporter [Alphaproteobacteria bacterium]MDE2042025.1 MFS transporter [Alphaproteobacteria bacterium]MDE2339918.1 MFS transporter [Alphaproteobacteria bacterium]